MVNLATPTGDEATDRAATEALLAPLRGTGRAFIYVSGTWVLGRTVTAATEQSRPDPIAIVGYRPAIERQVLAAAHEGVRGVVVRPGVVHGHGGGIPALLVDLARREGLGITVGDGSAAWPMVHLDDLARLFLLALEAPPGMLVHAVTEPTVPVTALAAAAARAAGVTKAVRHWPTSEAGSGPRPGVRRGPRDRADGQWPAGAGATRVGTTRARGSERPCARLVLAGADPGRGDGRERRALKASGQ